MYQKVFPFKLVKNYDQAQGENSKTSMETLMQITNSNNQLRGSAMRKYLLVFTLR